MANKWMTFGGSRGFEPGSGTTLYASIHGENGNGGTSSTMWETSAATGRGCVMASKITRVRVKLGVAPGAGNTWNFRLMGGIGGSTLRQSFAISDSTTEIDEVVDIAFSRGDVPQISLTRSGTPADTYFEWSLEWESTESEAGFCTIANYGNFGITANVDRFFNPYYSFPQQTTETNNEFIVPKDMTVRGMGVRIFGTPGTGESYDFTLRKNGVDTAITFNVTGSGFSSDHSQTVSYSKGDTMSIKVFRTTDSLIRAFSFYVLMDCDDEDEFITSSVFPNFFTARRRLVISNTNTNNRVYQYIGRDVKLVSASINRLTSNNSSFEFYLENVNGPTEVAGTSFTTPEDTSGAQHYDINTVIDGDETYAIYGSQQTGSSSSGTIQISHLWSLNLSEEPPEPAENWYNNDWEKRVKVTVQASQVSSTLTDFPVYVDLSALPAGFWSNVKNGGGDIRVTTSDETTEIAREVVSCNTSTDTGELHFKAPSISSSADTDFYIYFGNAAADDYAVGATYGRNNVWTEYAAVYHLEEDPTGSAPQMIDSTGNGNDLSTFGSAHANAAGKIAQGVALTNNGNYMEKSSPSNVADVDASQTFSAWFYNDDTSGVQNAVVTDGNIQIGYRGGSFGAQKGGGTFLVNSNNNYGTGAWFHGVYTFNGTTHTIYVNGSSVNTATTAPDTGSPTRITLGRFNASFPEEWRGRLDEVRISKVSIVRAAAWVDAEHTNQNTPNTFFNYGSVEDKPSAIEGWYNASWSNRVRVTVQASEVTSTLTDFPVYVDLSSLPAGFWSTVKNGGGDIRVTTSDGETEIAREVVFCDTSTDTGELHFKAPELSASVNTNFYVYFGNASADDYARGATYGLENVWTEYAAVYHFQQTPGGSDSVLDSTSNIYHGTPQGSMGAGNNITGKLTGNAYTFDGTDDNIVMGDVLDLGTNNAIISAWIRADNITSNSWVCSKGRAAAQDWRYGLRFPNTGGAGYFLQGDSGADVIHVGTIIDNNEWRLVHIVLNRSSTGDVYIDGAYDSGSTISQWSAGNFNSNNPFRIGSYTQNNNTSPSGLWPGDIDEFRMMLTADVSGVAAWIEAEHINQNTPDTFLSYGVVEEQPDGTILVDGLFYGGGI